MKTPVSAFTHNNTYDSIDPHVLCNTSGIQFFFYLNLRSVFIIAFSGVELAIAFIQAQYFLYWNHMNMKKYCL